MTQFDQVSASRAVLIEVMNVLGAFRDQIVLVGGWVPDLLYPGLGHGGSLDVDLAVSRKALCGNAYQSILKRMLDAKYEHKTSPTHFLRNVEGVEKAVKVDLISGQYEGGEKTLAIRVDELRLNTLRGLDLAFEVSQEIEISGAMPDGTQNTVRARIVRPEGFILIKAFALDERRREKDAYDIHFVLRNYEPDVEGLADRVRPLLSQCLARDGYGILRAKFATLDSVGPSWAAQVAASEHGEDFEQSQRSAFEYAQALFDATKGAG
jgi:predicted nucleotidyltransferase